MRLNRFIGNFDFTGPICRITDPELFNQINNVLRLEVGEQVILATGNGREVLAEIREVGKELIFGILEEKENLAESKKLVTLYCGILKKENFEWVAEKATECGINRLVPIITERTIKTGLKEERIKKIIKEASEQSGRGMIPEVGKTMSFPEALQNAKDEAVYFFDHSGSKIAMEDFSEKKIGIFIGPEGGWTESEIKLAESANCFTRSLGSLVLRGETAAVIASYISVH